MTSSVSDCLYSCRGFLWVVLVCRFISGGAPHNVGAGREAPPLEGAASLLSRHHHAERDCLPKLDAEREREVFTLSHFMLRDGGPARIRQIVGLPEPRPAVGRCLTILLSVRMKGPCHLRPSS